MGPDWIAYGLYSFGIDILVISIYQGGRDYSITYKSISSNNFTCIIYTIINIIPKVNN